MKILLVEDTYSVAVMLSGSLTSMGHEVSLAENGQIAFEKFCDLQPDLVLMDIKMPIMNGFESTTQIRAYEATQKWAWTPIIFMTASEAQDNLVIAIEAGGDDYLVKGVSENILQAKILAMARIRTLRQQLSLANQQLEYLASYDGLTGLHNRRRLDIDIDLAWTVAVHTSAPFAILMLDVDNFKKYNEHYGHLAGDDCLRALSNAIKKVIDQSNAEGLTNNAFVARYGGEEFTVAIPNASASAFEKCASRIIENVRNLKIPHAQNGEWKIATLSIGGCRWEVSSGEIRKMFADADAALFRAKENGRNRIVLLN